MKISYFFRIFLATFLIASFSTSCSSSEPQDMIIGKWKEANGPEVMEFSKDGSIKIDLSNMPPLNGQYTFVEKDKIKIDLGGIGKMMGTLVVTVEINKDEMILKNFNKEGSKQKYIKISEDGSQHVVEKKKNANKEKISQKPKKKKYKTDFSFADITWNDSPEKIENKLKSLDVHPFNRRGGQIRFDTLSVSYIGTGHIDMMSDKFEIRKIVSAINDPNLIFLREKRPDEDTYKDHIKLLEIDCDCKSKTGSFSDIHLWFSSIDKQLLGYVVHTKVIGHELFKSLSKKYGPPSKILYATSKRDSECGVKKYAVWKKNGQSLVWFGVGRDISPKFKQKKEENRFEKCKNSERLWVYKDSILLYLNNQALKPIAGEIRRSY